MGNRIWLALTNVMLPTEIPLEGDTLAVVVDVKFEPFMVTVVVPILEMAEGERLVIAGGRVTVKVRLLLVPKVVVAEMLRAPVAELEEMTSVAVICVDVTVGVPLKVMPEGRLRVAPVRLVPVIVTGTVAPRVPEEGEMAVNVGVGTLTVKFTELLVLLPVVAVMVRTPVVAFDAMTRLAVICVAVIVGVPLRVTPDGSVKEVPIRLVPAMVTGTVAPWNPDEGVMLVKAGAAATVKVRELLVLPPLVTAILLAPVAALEEMIRVVVI